MKTTEMKTMSDRVSETVWPWRGKSAAAPAAKGGASAKSLAIQVAAPVLAGVLLYAWLGKPVMAYAVWGLAFVLLMAGLFFPPAAAAVGRFGKRLGEWLGVIMSWVLLTPFFYISFGVMRISMKLRGKDPLQRKYDASKTSYWTPRKPVANAEQYKKQF